MRKFIQEIMFNIFKKFRARKFKVYHYKKNERKDFLMSKSTIGRKEYFKGRDDCLWIIYPDGAKCYRKGREDCLKTKFFNGNKEFYEGREDKLKYEGQNGTKEYYKGRDDCLEIIYENGETWFYEGREDKLYYIDTDGNNIYFEGKHQNDLVASGMTEKQAEIIIDAIKYILWETNNG